MKERGTAYPIAKMQVAERTVTREDLDRLLPSKEVLITPLRHN